MNWDAVRLAVTVVAFALSFTAVVWVIERMVA